jgi:hypothetical protein
MTRFENVGVYGNILKTSSKTSAYKIQKPGNYPEKIHTAFTARRKFEIKEKITVRNDMHTKYKFTLWAECVTFECYD